MSGWIRLHRKIRDHWIYQNAEYFKAWITVLMECNHIDNKVLIDGEILKCKRGQSVNSIKTWTKLFGKKWTRQKVRTFFSLLQQDNMIATKGVRKTTILTVLNYKTYQGLVTTDNQQITNR